MHLVLTSLTRSAPKYCFCMHPLGTEGLWLHRRAIDNARFFIPSGCTQHKYMSLIQFSGPKLRSLVNIQVQYNAPFCLPSNREQRVLCFSLYQKFEVTVPAATRRVQATKFVSG